MRAVLALALVGAAGFGLVRAADGPDLRAVDAPAKAINAGRGTLLAAIEFRGPGRVVRVRADTLRPVSPPLRLDESFAYGTAVSPDGRLLAVGSEMHSTIQLLDLRRWRRLPALELSRHAPPRAGGAAAVAWPSPRRLVVLAGPSYAATTPMVVDPIARRVVHRAGWRVLPLQWDSDRGRVVLLGTARWGRGPNAATLAAYDTRGRLRRVRLRRILAGYGDRGTGPARDLTPALAVDWRAGRAYAVSTDDRLVAEVDLHSWEVSYHELTEHRTAWGRLRELVDPPAHAKGEPVQVRARMAELLPNGAIAVTGEDRPATRPSHLSKPTPFGLRLIDPRTWTVRTVDAEAQDLTLAGGTVLARRWSQGGDGLRGIGLRAYDTAGELRWARFEGADTIVRGAAGRRAYVEVDEGGRRRIHVLDLDSGRTERTLPWSGIRVLDR
jgi:hypothetical protein